LSLVGLGCYIFGEDTICVANHNFLGWHSLQVANQSGMPILSPFEFLRFISLFLSVDIPFRYGLSANISMVSRDGLLLLYSHGGFLK
jgi:hypothetical protein